MADPSKNGDPTLVQQPYPTPYQTSYPPAYPPPATDNQYPPPAGPPPGNQYPPPTGPPPANPYPAPNDPPPAYGAPPPQAPIYPPQNAASEANLEVGFKSEDGMFSFNEKTVRLAFIRKVYGILALQMAVTVGMSCLFMFHLPTKLFVQEHIALYLTAYGLFIGLYFVLACCTSVARSYPTNIIMLGVFTLSLGFMVGVITSFHDTDIVLMAFGITLVVCVAVMLFACQTKYDFTTCGGLLFVLTITLIFFGLFAAVLVPTGRIGILNMVYSALGALLFMGFLAFDTQLIMGGNKYEIDPEDYVFAAMMLYVDIIYIFLFILSLLNGGSS